MASANIGGANQGQLKRPLMVSATLHVCLGAALAAGTLLHGKMVLWGEAGGGGGAASVRLVSAASVPLPQPTIPTENHVATENPAQHYTEPAPKSAVKNPPPDQSAIPIPAKNAKQTPPPKKPAATVQEPQAPKQIASTGSNTSPIQPTRHYKQADEPVTTNEVPYGEGGPATGPYGMFQSDSGSGGVRIAGDAGDFLSRYSWYVTAIRNRISNNWLKTTVDPSIHTAPRVYVTFQVFKDGSVVNPQVTASSGISSLDRSALRAVFDSNPMPPLPPDYPNSSVSVEFWFDFRR